MGIQDVKIESFKKGESWWRKWWNV